MCAQYSASNVRVLTPGGAHAALASISNTSTLLPDDGLWCVKYEVFRNLASNYRIITHELQSNVCTMSAPGEAVRDVSFGSSYKVPRGFVYMCNFYVDTKLDDQSQARLQISHVLKHLVLIAQRFKGEFVQFP